MPVADWERCMCLCDCPYRQQPFSYDELCGRCERWWHQQSDRCKCDYRDHDECRCGAIKHGLPI